MLEAFAVLFFLSFSLWFFLGGFSRGGFSWSHGCEGVVAASQYWFFTLVTFISIILFVGSSGLPFFLLLVCFPTFRVLWGLALLLLLTFSFSWVKGGT